jgi:hypothetical protein
MFLGISNVHIFEEGVHMFFNMVLRHIKQIIN